MSLRLKVILIFLGTLVILTGSLYWISSAFLMSAFIRMDEQTVQNNLLLSQKALANQLEEMDKTANDWGPWDDTYQFINDLNEDYIEGNLNDPTVANLDLNFLIYLDATGQLIYAKGLDLETEKDEELTPNLKAYLGQNPTKFRFTSSEDYLQGIIGLPEGLLLIAARPILPSSAGGMIRGTLICGRWLDQKIKEDITLGFEDVEVYPLNGITQLPPEAQPVLLGLNAAQTQVIQPKSESIDAGYFYLKDLDGQPIALVQGVSPRDLYQHGRSLLKYLLLLLIGISGILAVLIWGLLNGFVLSPLIKISDQVQQIGMTQDFSSHVRLSSKDEVSILADKIDSTLHILNQSQLALRETEEKYRNLVENSADWVWEIDEKGIFRYANPRVEEILGYLPEEVIGKTNFDFMTSEELERIKETLAPLLENHLPIVMFEMCLTHRNRNPVMLEVSATPILTREGEFRGYRGISRDISNHWSVEEALRESEHKYRTLFNYIPDCIFIFDKETYQFLDCNQAVQTLYGFSLDELRQMTPFNLLPVEDLERTRPNIHLTHREVPIHSTHETKAGRRIQVEILSDEILYQGKPAWINIVRDVTDRKTMEEALKIEHDIVQSIFNSSPDAITITDMDGIIVDCNQALLDMFGRESKAGIIGDSVFDSLVHADYPRAKETLMEAARNSLLRNVEFSCVRHGGIVFPTENSASVTNDAYGKPRFIIILSKDITERKRAEKIQSVLYEISQATNSTKSLEELFQSIYEIVNELIQAKNLFIALYDAHQDLLTFPFFVDEFDPPPPPKRPMKGLTEYVLTTGQPLMADPIFFEGLVEEGVVESIGTASIDWLGVPLKTQDRTIGVLVTQTYDEGVRFGKEEMNILSFVSNQIAMAIERKMAESYRFESEARLRRITDNMLDLISETDEQGIIRYASPSHTVVLGYHPDDLVGKPILNMIHADDQEKFSHKLHSDGDIESVSRIEFRFQHADGRYVPMDVVSTLLLDDDDNFIGAVHGSRDITDRKRAEEALRESEERYRNLVEYQGEGICIFDTNFRFVFTNGAGERVFGVDSGCLLGCDLRDFALPDDHETLKQQQIQRQKGASGTYELKIRRGDGQERDLLITASPWLDSRKEFIGSFAVFRDISERKQVEEKLEFLSMHDVITGLHNRAYFEDRMAFLESEQQYPVSIVYADMNGLKQINDSRGHAAGDDLLRQTGMLLRASFRGDDVVARLGGDEFGVLLPGADPTDADQAIKRLRSNIELYNLHNPTLPISISIGLATSYPGVTLKEVLHLADQHMYADKPKKSPSYPL